MRILFKEKIKMVTEWGKIADRKMATKIVTSVDEIITGYKLVMAK